jgi:hypothetical protein
MPYARAEAGVVTVALNCCRLKLGGRSVLAAVAVGGVDAVRRETGVTRNKRGNDTTRTQDHQEASTSRQQELTSVKP